MGILKCMQTSVVWSLDGAIFGLLGILIYSIIRSKLNEINRK